MSVIKHFSNSWCHLLSLTTYTGVCRRKIFSGYQNIRLKVGVKNFLSEWWKFLIPITLNETEDLIKTNWCCCHVALMFLQVFRCLRFCQIKEELPQTLFFSQHLNPTNLGIFALYPWGHQNLKTMDDTDWPAHYINLTSVVTSILEKNISLFIC